MHKRQLCERKGTKRSQAVDVDKEIVPSDTGTEDDTASDTEASLKGPSMFDGLTAWFSSSVQKERIQAWEVADGQLAQFDTAMYVFSEDADCDDTKCIYESDDYLTDNLAIFHASYIDECLEKKNMKEVVIGKYFLPPAELQAAIRHRTQFHWETKEKLRKPSRYPNTRTSPHKTDPRSTGSQSKSVTSTSSQPLQQPSQDPRSGPSNCSTQATSRTDTPSGLSVESIGGSLDVCPDQITAGESNRKWTVAISDQPTAGHQDKRSKQPASQELPAYIPLGALTLASGRLYDFVVGVDGCTVQMKVK